MGQEGMSFEKFGTVRIGDADVTIKIDQEPDGNYTLFTLTFAQCEGLEQALVQARKGPHDGLVMIQEVVEKSYKL